MVIDKKMEVFKEIAEYLNKIAVGALPSIEENGNDKLVANFYIFGFNSAMFSVINEIAKKYNMKVSFDVEPSTNVTVRLILVINEVSKE